MSSWLQHGALTSAMAGLSTMLPSVSLIPLYTIDRLAKVLLKTLVELLLSDTLVRVEFSKKRALLQDKIKGVW